VRSKRALPQQFDLTGATKLGGLNAIGCFIKKLGVDRELRRRFKGAKAAWATWSLDQTVRMMIDACLAGVERLYHFEDLERDALLCASLGVERLCDTTTLYRDLRRFEDGDKLDQLKSLVDDVVVDALRGQRGAVLEFDSTVESLWGEQEGVEVGPNPHRPGRPSYHPLLARERNSDLVVNHVLRPGNVGTANGINPFLHHTLDLLARAGLDNGKVRARLDSGFESDEVLRALEWRRVGYVVKMRATSDVAHFAACRKGWRNLDVDADGEIQVLSFEWKRPVWKKSRRIVAVRKRGLDHEQGRLFDDAGWFYSLYVTNLDWDPEDVARFYDKRADVERTICELKNDLAIANIPSAVFAANAADLAIKILARNLLILYRDKGLRLRTRFRVATLRRRFLLVPGRLVSHAGRQILKLAHDSPLAHVLQPQPLRA
jgi:hypothetical protein